MATDFDALLLNHNDPPYTGRWFSADSYVNRRLPDDAPLDANSDAFANAMANRGLPSRIQSHGYGIEAAGFSLFAWWYSTVNIFIVNRDDPDSYTLEDFTLDRTTGQRALFPKLQQAFTNVPVPLDARPGSHGSINPASQPGMDNHLCIYDPSTDRMWECWKANKVEVDTAHDNTQRWWAGADPAILNAPGWHFGFGGAISNVHHHQGYFDGLTDWDGGQDTGIWGATAPKIPQLAGVIRSEEAVAAHRGEEGAIQHIISCGVGSPHYANFRWPAQTTDGNSQEPFAPQEGMIFRFPPGYDCEANSGGSNFRMEVIRAIRDYGLVVRDYAGGVTMYCECRNSREGVLFPQKGAGGVAIPGYSLSSFKDDIWLGDDNATGAHHDGIFSDTPTNFANQMPWADLQTLSASYRPTTPHKARLIIGSP